MIYYLTQQILAVLEGIPKIKKVYPYPLGEDESISTYPAVIFLQDSFDNGFETNRENKKEYRFKIWVVIGVENDTVENIFTNALPKTMDAVIAAFDAAWSGQSDTGHRITYVLSSGTTAMNVATSGRQAIGEMNLNIRVLTTN